MHILKPTSPVWDSNGSRCGHVNLNSHIVVVVVSDAAVKYQHIIDFVHRADTVIPLPVGLIWPFG